MSMKSIVFWMLLVSLVVLAHCQSGGESGDLFPSDQTDLRSRVQENDPTDICLLANDPGRCIAYFPMWFYNPSSGKCESFVYGGCRGNANKFATKADCIHRCVCSRPAYTGRCRAGFYRYYYDKSTSSCKQFIYGGCNSNGNNFRSVGECLATCA